jgi:KDO2-lipid IV(A) lauroyltransferase
MNTVNIQLFSLRHWPTWLGLAGLRLLVYLPYAWQLSLGHAVGRLMYGLATKSRHTSQTNIDLCFPDSSVAEKQQLVKNCFISMGIGLFETGLAWWAPTKRLMPLVKIHGLEYIETALQKGKGVILFGAHFTTLEIVGRLLAQNLPFAVVYRRQKNLVLDFLNQYYLQKYYQMAIAREDIRGTLRCLKHNIPVWYTPDVDAGIKSSVFVPFFGIQAASVTATTRFTKLSQASSIPVSFYRREDGSGYDIIFQPPLTNYPSDNLMADTARINQALEDAIRKRPEQYLWSYKRFKTRPPGEARIYKHKE